MKRLISGMTLVILLALDAGQAGASTLPRADLGPKDSRYFGLGAGHGLSVSVDFPLSPALSAGGCVGTGVLAGSIPTLYDLRLVYDFVRGGRRGLSIAGIAGVWGGTGYGAFTGPGGLASGLEIGFGLSFPFTSQWTGRLNLMVPYYGLPAGPYYLGYGGPSGGFEVGYRVSSYLEATLGSNGQGDLLGVKLDF